MSSLNSQNVGFLIILVLILVVTFTYAFTFQDRSTIYTDINGISERN